MDHDPAIHDSLFGKSGPNFGTGKLMKNVLARYGVIDILEISSPNSGPKFGLRTGPIQIPGQNSNQGTDQLKSETKIRTTDQLY